MFRFGVYLFTVLLIGPGPGILLPKMASASEFKVLAVMSYEDDFPWCNNIKEGIESVLRDVCDVRYFYLDTKKNIEGGKRKAREAYELYRAFKPDGVIAADDNAQSMFVLPYLKNKEKTPVMFCGVNAEPEKYGYPASNVSGILERPHFSESLAFARLIVPAIKTFGFIIKESPTGRAHLNQVQKEVDTYPAELTSFKMPGNIKEAVEMIHEFREKNDAMLLSSLAGVSDASGRTLSEKEAAKMALKIFGNKPTIGSEEYTVKYGALCAVVRTGQEQGNTAAEMLLKAMQGTPVSQIPVTRNIRGKRLINVMVMKSLGIKPRPNLLRGAELVRTEK